MAQPTLGTYCLSLEPILDQLIPSDCDTDFEGEPAVLVGFNNTAPVTGQLGEDRLCAYITFDRRKEPMINFAVPIKHSK